MEERVKGRLLSLKDGTRVSMFEIKKEKSKRAEFEKRVEIIYGTFSRQDKLWNPELRC